MDPNLGYVTPPPKESFKLSKKMLIIGAGLVVALVTSIALIASSSGGGTSKQIQHLAVRLDNLQILLSNQKITRNLKSSELNNISTSFNLTVTTDVNSLINVLGVQYPKKVDKNIELAESDVQTNQSIEEAYLKNDLDRVYADVLTKKIASIRALLAEIYGLSKSQKLKNTLEEIDNHMKTTSDQLEKLQL